jgi:signal transduction histidine kinase
MLQTARHGPEDFVIVDLEAIVGQVERLVEPKLRSRHIDVQTSFKPVPPVRGYPLYIQEAILNLVNNASDAMPDGGALTLDVWHDAGADRVRVRVSDTGSGIDPQIVERVFEGFVTTKDLGSGTGLGLAIVRDIMSSHGGSVELSSPNGRGTTALLTFPPAAGDGFDKHTKDTGR